MSSFVLRQARVLDASGGFTSPVDVRVRAGVIDAVGPDLPIGEDPSYDFAGLWIMPGVFDCHDHVMASSLDAMELLRTPITQWTLEGAVNLRRTLEAGVTFVRDAGGADVGIRESIERGYIAGPRLQVSVVALSQTGGHIDGFLPGPGLEISADYVIPDYPGRPPYLVDGPDEMRKAVRQVLRAGADWIKLCTTGGVLSPHDDGNLPEFTLDEISVAVHESGRKGKGVMVHAFGGEGIDNAVRAGVRSIEHGIFLTEEQGARMARTGVWMVPTLAVIRDVIDWAKQGLIPPYGVQKALTLEPLVGEAVQIARECGVRIAVGTDYVSRDEHGRNLEELTLLHQAGLTAEETLLAATITGAELCGVADRLGRITLGYTFDALVLEKDPSDMRIFSEPRCATGVFKAGIPVVRHERLQ